MNAITSISPLPATDDVEKGVCIDTDVGSVTGDIYLDYDETRIESDCETYPSDVCDCEIVGMNIGGGLFIGRDQMCQMIGAGGIEHLETIYLEARRELA